MGTPQEPVRLAVVGLGTVAQLVYLPLLARRRDLFRLVAVCDRSPRAVATIGDQWSVPHHRRLETVEEVAACEEIDAVLLLTSGSHGQAARVLTEAGIAVLCEKPLAFTREEAEQLKGSDRLHLGYMKQLDPAVETAAVDLREVGSLRSVEITVLHPSLERQLTHLGRSPQTWPPPATVANTDAELRTIALGPAGATTLGSIYTDVLLGSVIHELSVLRATVGPLATVDAVSEWAGDVGRSLVLTGQLPGDARVDIGWHLMPDYPAYREQVRVHGERGSIEFEFPSPYLLHAPTTYQLTTAEGEGHRQLHRTSHREAFERQLERFHAVALGLSAPPSGAVEGLEDIITCQSAMAVLAAQQGVTIGGEAAL
ncbi:Gfo/Idh/MocA family protein [Egibacter rhizosphaerae]|nr:Gfo/Idh/MocA family oxidoreductase [Egibacter rhizosphaerae]